MNILDTLCLWTGRIQFILGGVLVVALISSQVCDLIFRHMRITAVFWEFLMERKRKQAGKV